MRNSTTHTASPASRSLRTGQVAIPKMISRPFAFCSLLTATVSIAAALRSSPNNLGKLLSKRQNSTDCNQDLQDICESDTADCIAATCKACSGWVIIADCCALSTYTLMLQCLLDGLQNPSVETVGTSSVEAPSGTITGAYSTATDSTLAGLQACANFESMVFSCGNESPALSTAPFTQRADCLCYANGTYQPSSYDGALSTCLAYLSVAAPADYASITSSYSGSVEMAPCSQLGVASPPTTSSTVYIGQTSVGSSGPTSSASPSQVITGSATESVTSGSLRLEMVSRPRSLVESGIKLTIGGRVAHCHQAGFDGFAPPL